MTPAGLAAIELAVANGTWTASDASDEQIEPDDLRARWRPIPGRAAFASLQPSVRKGILYWIASAKRPRRAPARRAHGGAGRAEHPGHLRPSLNSAHWTEDPEQYEQPTALSQRPVCRFHIAVTRRE